MVFLIFEVAGDLEREFFFGVFDFAFFFDDESERGALDTASGDGAWDFSPDDAGEVEADEHVESLASLLGADHCHVDGSWRFDGGLKSGFSDFVESDSMGGFGEV